MSLRFEHGFPNDVFISIAESDDAQGVSSLEWGSRFADALTRRVEFLSRKTLRIRHDSHLFSGNAASEQLEASALLVVVVSPAYLASAECARHRGLFPSSRILRVDKAPVPDGAMVPPDVAALVRHKCYRKEPDGAREFLLDPADITSEEAAVVDDFSRHVLERLTALESAPARTVAGASSSATLQAASGPVTPPRDSVVVHLALATGDIDSQCGELRRWFEDGDYQIVGGPVRARDAASFRAEMSVILAGASLAVFPVGRLYGWQPADGDGKSFMALQLEEAVNCPGVDRIVWIPKGLDRIEEPQQNLIDEIRKTYPSFGFEVLEVGVQQLAAHLKARKKPALPAEPSADPAADLRVYFMCDLCDYDSATPYRQFLLRKGVELDWLSKEGAEAGNFHRDWLAEDQGFVIYYANSDDVWYRRQELELRKAKGYRRKPGGDLKSLTLLDPPVSDHKNDLRLKPSRVLDGLPPKELEEKLKELDAFVDALKRNGGGSPPP